MRLLACFETETSLDRKWMNREAALSDLATEGWVIDDPMEGSELVISAAVCDQVRAALIS